MPPASPTPSISRRRRRRRKTHVQIYDASTDEEVDDSEQDEAPTAARPPAASVNLGHSTSSVPDTASRPCSPPRPLASSHTKVRNPRPSDSKGKRKSTSLKTGGCSSVLSYEDSPSPRLPSSFQPISCPSIRNDDDDDDDFHDPPPPSKFQNHQKQPKPTVRRRPRTNSGPPSLDRTYTSSTRNPGYLSSSTSGFWQPVKRTHVSSLKRSKTVREPASLPAQAILPRAPRNLAAVRLPVLHDEDDDDDDDDDDETARVAPYFGTPTVALPQKPIAGGKKAALAIELKMNLEIELELKACINGNVMLELFF